MLVVSNDTITVTRADDFMLHIDIMMQDGVLYDLKEGDKLTFYLYKKPSKLLNNPPIFSKEFIEGEVNILSIETQFLIDDKYYYACVLESVEFGTNTVLEGKLYLTY